MRQSTALLLLGMLPSIAHASDPTGLAYVMIIQVVMLAWPLVLPSFYLRPQRNKLHSYFLFVVLAYGLLGIVGLPQLLFTNIAAWFSAEDAAFRWAVPLNIGKHLVAIALFIWYLPRFAKLVSRQPPSAT